MERIKMDDFSKNHDGLFNSKFSEEERRQICEEMEKEHLEMVRAFVQEQHMLRKKYEPRYQWIDYGYRCRYFDDSKYEKAKNNGLKFVENFETLFWAQRKGIYISGPTGTGKSHLAAMIANEMADRDYIVYMARINDAIDQFNDLSDKTLASMIKNRSFDLIILDDLGSSRTTDYQVERLFNLIDSIYIAKIPLIVTTNLPIVALTKEQNMGLKRVYDRILEMSAYFPPMTGDSKRIEEAKRLMGITKSLFD